MQTSTSWSIHVMKGTEVTEDVLEECAVLFSEEYGIWGPRAAEVSRRVRPGQRVRMGHKTLRQQCLSHPEKTVLAICRYGGTTLIAHAFATSWEIEGVGLVGWVTQLVVGRGYRRRSLASHLLTRLASTDHVAFGLVSSHPAACRALSKLGIHDFKDLDLNFIATMAPRVIASTPITYLQTAQLRGSLFEPSLSAEESVICSVFTNFYVDHQEPLEALEAYASTWPLGALQDGHEFLLMVPTKL